MQGTVVGDWVAHTFAQDLRKLRRRDFPKGYDGALKSHGLSFHDPNYDPGKARIGKDVHDRTIGSDSTGKTVAEAEQAGESLGLERYQAFYSASNPTPTKRHTVPLIDGACGLSCVLDILRMIGLSLHKIHSTSKVDVYVIERAKRR